MDSNKVEASRSKEKVPETNKRQDGAASRDKNLSYADQLSRGISGLETVSLLKELRSSQLQNREKDSSSDRRIRLRSNSSLDVDLFAEARKCVGLFPVKAKHILDFHTGDYDISNEDIPQLPDLRDLAAREFLFNELKWKEDVQLRTNWSQERNILWVTLPNENLVSSIFKRQA